MRLRKSLARLAGTSFAAIVLAVTGFAGAASADTPYQEIRPVSGSIGGLFTNVKCLDVRREDGFDNPNARIQQWDCSGANEQQFRSHPFARDPSGFRWLYQIQGLRSGQCIEVRDGLLTAGAQIDQYPCDTSGVVTGLNARQLWMVTRFNGTPEYMLQPYSALSAGLNMCLDVKAGENSNGVMIQQWTCNLTLAQRFFGPFVDDGEVVG